MAPILHSHIIPETESSCLVRRELRILLDPRTITEETRPALIHLDILRQYLASLPGLPCSVSLLAPAPGDPAFEAQHELICRYGGQHLRYATIVIPEVATALGEIGTRHPDFLALASTAVACDADMVVTTSPGEGVCFDDEFCRRLFIVFGDVREALRLSEVFVRGHEVPWSFRLPMWNCPWTPFYSMIEPATAVVLLLDKARARGMDPRILEILRSLAYNRPLALCYTRDKLHFYVLQRRAALRQKLTRQMFGFELGYYLNHYYLLLWAGLDQLCRVVNAVFDLGLTTKQMRRAGPLNAEFVKVLRQKAPGVAAAYENPEFIHWARILRGARHWVAHEGLAMPTTLFLREGDEPTEEELDREVEASDEWHKLRATEWLVPGVLETFRPMLRHQARLRHLRAMPEPVLRVEVEDGEEGLTYPLLNIQWDFDNFLRFANRIAELAMARLAAGGPEAPEEAVGS